MISFRNMPISRKLVVVMMASAAAAMLLGGTVSIVFEYNRYRSAIMRNTTAQTDLLAEAVSAALAFQDPGTAQEMLNSLRGLRDVLSAELYAEDGQLFAEYHRGDVRFDRPMVQKPTFAEGMLHVCQPVTLGNDRVGVLCLRTSLREHQTRQRTYGWIAAGVIGLSLCASLVVAQRLKRFISDPLLALTRAMREVAARGDFSLRAERASDDEIGALADGFNQMLAQIQRSEESLMASEERFRQVTENIREVFWMTDLEKSRMLYVSRAYEEIWGWPVGTLYAEPRSWLESIHPEDRERVRATLGQQANGRYDEVYRVLRPDGTVRWIRDRAFPVRDAAGKVYRIAGIAEDITERHETERALQHSESRLKAILQNTTAVVYMKDTDGRYLLINHRYEQLFHVSQAQIAGKTDFDLFPKHEAEALRKNDLEVLRSGKPIEFEEVVPHDDGPHTYVSVKFPLLDAAGHPYAVCGISTDITARKRAEEALRESSQKYRLLVENIDEIIYRVRIGGDVLRGELEYVSPRLKEILGYDPEQFMGDASFWLEQVHPDDLAGLKPVTREILQSGQAGVRVYRFRHGRTGEYRWMEDRIAPVCDESGNVVGFQGASRDITERRHAEQELRMQARVLETMVEGVMVYDEEERIVFTNAALEAMFGYERGELLGQSTDVLNPYPPDICARISAHVRQELKLRRSIQRQFRNRRKDGSEFISESRICELRINGTTGCVAVVQDVTERLRLEREILGVREREQARIGQDLHDGLCQHLYSTGLAANLLHEVLAAQARPEAEQAGKIAELLESAIAQSRQIARGLYPVRLEAEGLPSALHELAMMTSKRFHLDCRAHCNKSVRPMHNSTAIHLFRIAQEAVSNAVRHADASHVRIKLAAGADGGLVLSISDDGKGLPALRPSGMGLNIMTYRARMIGGLLEIQPGPTGGTIVTCSIPPEVLHEHATP